MNICVATHGEFGDELVKSASMIIGPVRDVHVFSLLPGVEGHAYAEEIDRAMQTMEGDIFCMVDLFGGTPCNMLAMLSRKHNLSLVSGVNLPMFIEVYMKASNGEKNLEQIAVDTCKSSSMNVLEHLGKGRNKNGENFVNEG